ncbi:DUF2971 domain-containing protein [Caballeronia sp. KNU42]
MQYSPGVRPMPPDYLYKYTALQAPTEGTCTRGFRARLARQPRFDALLSSHQVWFAAPSSFNDPMDCKPRFRFEGGSNEELERFRRNTIMHMVKQDHPHSSGDELVNIVAEYLTSYPRADAGFLALAHLVMERELRNVGVLCLSECGCDPVMFYHYGDQHRGMCLKFRSIDFFAHAEPVRYSMDYPVVDFFDDEDLQEQFTKIFFTKYQGWSYEHEWRVVDFDQDPARRLRNYSSELLEGVIFGYQMPQVDRARAIELLQQRRHPVKLFTAKVNEAHYLLDIVPCGET